MYRLWTFLRLVGLGIPDGQCGVRGTQRIFQMVGCHGRHVFRPWLRKSGLTINIWAGVPRVLPGGRNRRYTAGGMGGDNKTLLPSWFRAAVPCFASDGCLSGYGGLIGAVVPNRVQSGKLQDVPDEGSLLNVSPASPGFLMRPLGAAVHDCRCCWPWIVLVTLCSVIRLLLLNVLWFRGRIPL